MHAGDDIMEATMRATIYAPPGDGFPHVAVVFHTDGTVLLARPFDSAEAAQQYITDVSSSLVAIGATYGDAPQEGEGSIAVANESELSLD